MYINNHRDFIMLAPFSIIVDAETTSTQPDAKVSEFSALIFDHISKQVIDHIQLHFDLNNVKEKRNAFQ